MERIRIFFRGVFLPPRSNIACRSDEDIYEREEVCVDEVDSIVRKKPTSQMSSLGLFCGLILLDSFGIFMLHEKL